MRWSAPRTTASAKVVARTSPGAPSLASLADGLTGLALDVLALDRLALVVGLLAPGEADLQLDAPVLVVGLQRDDRQPFFGGLAPELQDLALVQQQPPLAVLCVVHQVAVAVRADAAAHQEQLARAEHDEGVA